MNMFYEDNDWRVSERDQPQIIDNAYLYYEILSDPVSWILPMSLYLFQLAQILPTEETFLLLFRRDNPLESSVEFMKVMYCSTLLWIWLVCFVIAD